MKALYSQVVTADAGRDGYARRSDGRLDVELRVPTKMAGPGRKGTDVSATGGVIRSVPDAKYFPSVELEAKVDGLSPKETLEVFPYSNAIRGNMDVRLSAH
jgi:organic hydroperoxide reductase OsmC/OhrA